MKKKAIDSRNKLQGRLDALLEELNGKNTTKDEASEGQDIPISPSDVKSDEDIHNNLSSYNDQTAVSE